MFSWANSQLEKLSETLAPPPTTPGPRYLAALALHDEATALSIINDQNPVQQLDIYTPLKPTHGICPIHVAAQYGALQVLRTLLQRGVTVNSTDYNGLTPLHYASSSTYITPQQSLGVVKYLVEECGANVLTKNQDGFTPYDIASSQAVRGYLLPKQLQAETVIMEEEAKLQGGNHVTQIAPPPTMMRMMSGGGGGVRFVSCKVLP